MQFVGRQKVTVQKENLWFFFLAPLSSNERSGFELRRLIKERFGFWSGNVTAYRVLYDLERSGLVTTEARDRRKYYRITGEGRKELAGPSAFQPTLLAETGGYG